MGAAEVALILALFVAGGQADGQEQYPDVIERLEQMETLARLQQETSARLASNLAEQSRARAKMAAELQAQRDVINGLKAAKMSRRQTDGEEGGEGGAAAVISKLQQQVVKNTADIQTVRDCACSGGDGDAAAASGAGSGAGSGSGSTFVRWGSSSCGTDASLVYSGLAGGSYWAHSGAAATTLCLTQTPVFAPRQVPVTYYANLYGAEYETHDDKQNHDVLCAVCRAQQASTITVPGTNVCPSGWTLQYGGYLMAGHWSQAGASDYICVDTALEARTGSSQNIDGHSLFFTASRCGALPCAPYQENKVMTCAVCSA